MIQSYVRYRCRHTLDLWFDMCLSLRTAWKCGYDPMIADSLDWIWRLLNTNALSHWCQEHDELILLPLCKPPVTRNMGLGVTVWFPRGQRVESSGEVNRSRFRVGTFQAENQIKRRKKVLSSSKFWCRFDEFRGVRNMNGEKNHVIIMQVMLVRS